MVINHQQFFCNTLYIKHLDSLSSTVPLSDSHFISSHPQVPLQGNVSKILWHSRSQAQGSFWAHNEERDTLCPACNLVFIRPAEIVNISALALHTLVHESHMTKVTVTQENLWFIIPRMDKYQCIFRLFFFFCIFNIFVLVMKVSGVQNNFDCVTKNIYILKFSHFFSNFL